MVAWSSARSGAMARRHSGRAVRRAREYQARIPPEECSIKPRSDLIKCDFNGERSVRAPSSLHTSAIDNSIDNGLVNIYQINTYITCIRYHHRILPYTVITDKRKR